MYKIIRNEEEVIEIASVGSSKVDLVFYNLLTDKKHKVNNAHNNEIYMVKYYYFTALNHHLLLTSSFDKSIKIWNINEDPINIIVINNCHLRQSLDPFCMLFLQDVCYIIGGCVNRKMRIWDKNLINIGTINNCELVKYFYIETYYIGNIPLIILCGKPHVEVLEFKNCRLKKFKDKDYYMDDNSMQVSHNFAELNKIKDTLFLFDADDSGILRVFDYETERLYKRFDTNGIITYSLCMYNEHNLITGGADENISIINLDNFRIVKEYGGFKGSVFNVKKAKLGTEDEEFIITGCKEGTIKIWKP